MAVNKCGIGINKIQISNYCYELKNKTNNFQKFAT